MGYILADDMTYSSQRLRHRTPPAKLISVLLLQPYPQTKAIRVTHKKEKQMYVVCIVYIRSDTKKPSSFEFKFDDTRLSSYII